MYVYIHTYTHTHTYIGCTAKHVGSLFPDQGLNLCPLQCQHGVLTTGLPGKTLLISIITHLQE